MPPRLTLRSTLKRGALVAAANWPVTILQATADSLFKLLLAVPVLGGVFLVVLVLGTDPQALMAADWRDLIPTIVATLVSRPLVLGLFLLALAVVVAGGSLFVFLVKAGTVGVLAASERQAGPVEDEPVHVATLSDLGTFSVDAFIAAARTHFPSYARLGMLLMLTYAASGGAYLALLASGGVERVGWALTTLVTTAFVAWITLINLLYLLTQIAISAERCGVMSAFRRVAAFLRRQSSAVARIFLVVLALVVAATGASLAAAAALGLIWFVPFVGLAVLPLQLLAALLRALVFQFIGLTSIGAYLRVYREFAAADHGHSAVPSYPELARPVSQS